MKSPAIELGRKKAQALLAKTNWPNLIFTDGGEGGPRLKKHINKIKKGKVPLTYWANDDYDTPLGIESQSWDHEESGHSQTGINELDAVVGNPTALHWGIRELPAWFRRRYASWIRCNRLYRPERPLEDA